MKVYEVRSLVNEASHQADDDTWHIGGDGGDLTVRVGRVLDWKPKVSLHPLVRLMVEHDLATATGAGTGMSRPQATRDQPRRPPTTRS
jgi:hypothetical protein